MAGDAYFGPVKTAMPWDWNPIGVGISAYNDAKKMQLIQQESNRAEQKSAIENEVARITMPYVSQKLQLEMANLSATNTQLKATAEAQTALANYRSQLAENGSITDPGFSSPTFDKLFGTPPAPAAAPVSPGQMDDDDYDQEQTPVAPMLNSTQPMRLDLGANNPLKSYQENPAGNALISNFSRPEPTRFAPVGSDEPYREAPAAVMSDFQREEVQKNAAETIKDQEANPLTGPRFRSPKSIMPSAPAAPSYADRLKNTISMHGQFDQERSAAYASANAKQRTQVRAQTAAANEAIAYRVQDELGLDPETYGKTRNWNDASWAKFDTLLNKGGGSLDPRSAVLVVEAQNIEDVKKMVAGAGEFTPSDIDAQIKARKQAAEAETNPALKKQAQDGAIIFERNTLRKAYGVPDYDYKSAINSTLGEMKSAQAADNKEGYSSGYANLQEIVRRAPRDVDHGIVYMDDVYSSLREKPEDQQRELLNQILDGAEKRGSVLLDGGQITTPDMIGKYRAGMTKAAEKATAETTRDESVAGRVNGAIAANRDKGLRARAQKEKDVEARRAPYIAAQEKRNAEIKEFDALYDGLVAKGDLPGQRAIGNIFGVETTGANRAVDPALFGEAVTRMEQILKQLPAKDRWKASGQSRLDRVKALQR